METKSSKEKKPSTLLALIRTAAFLAVLALALQATAWVLLDKRYAPYSASIYEEERNSLDVLLMGSSHMLTAVSPLLLWEEQGIASNNLAQNGQVIPVSYYHLQEALRTQKPKLVVLDVYKVIQDSLIDSEASLHYTLDNMRPGLPKIQAAFDLMPEGSRSEFVLNIMAYHDRWKELTGEDFMPLDTTTKGLEVLFGTTPMPDFVPLPASAAAEPAACEIEYLEKMVELCREEGIDLLLVAAPFVALENDEMQRQQRVNAMTAYARKWDVPFVNMMHLTEEMGFDFGTDMADVFHVNRQGMEKVTAWLGTYLAEHYDLPDHRGEAAYADWDKAAEDFHAYLDKNSEAAQS